MQSIPKSSAQILAEAREVPTNYPRPVKSRQKSKAGKTAFDEHLITFQLEAGQPQQLDQPEALGSSTNVFDTGGNTLRATGVETILQFESVSTPPLNFSYPPASIHNKSRPLTEKSGSMPLTYFLSHDISLQDPTEEVAVEMDSETSSESSDEEHKTKKQEAIDQALLWLRGAHLSPFDLALIVLDQNEAKFRSYRTAFYRDDSRKMGQFLDTFCTTHSGCVKFKTWLRDPCRLDTVRSFVNDEMDVE